MITKEELLAYQERVSRMLEKAGIVITPKEREEIEVADFGLSNPEVFGLQLVIYINTSRCCAKELVLFPGQICPEHRHPAINSEPGKEETFRCRWGQVYLYVPGAPVENPRAKAPEEARDYFTVWHEIVLHPGEQYTLLPNTLHWFQAGPEGAIVSEFSTKSRDEYDIFTDPRIARETKITE